MGHPAAINLKFTCNIKIDPMKTIATEDLDIGFDVYGTSSQRVPVILLHGFPDDASALLGIGHLLAAGGHYAIAPMHVDAAYRPSKHSHRRGAVSHPPDPAI